MPPRTVNSRLTHAVHQYSLHHGGRSTWENKAKRLFSKVGFRIPEGEISQAGVLHDIKILLQGLDQEQWWFNLLDDKNCPNGNKLRTYRLHKNVLQTEIYIKEVSRFNRSTIAKLRCGSLPFNVETGRYKNVPLQLRTCILCDTHEIENEVHFTIDCPFYEDLRYPLLNLFNLNHNDFNMLPSLAKYCNIMSDTSNVKLVANIIDKMFKRRQSYCQ